MRLVAVWFTINGQLFLTEIAEDGSGRTCMLAADGIAAGEGATPVLNPRISPDGRHVAYTTGEHLMLVDIAPQWPSDSRRDDATDDDCDGQPAPHAHGHRCGDEESGAPYDPSADKLSTLWSVYPDDDADENTWKIGLAEFVAGEEMDRYDGFWWGRTPVTSSSRRSTRHPSRCGTSATRRTRRRRPPAVDTRVRSPATPMCA